MSNYECFLRNIAQASSCFRYLVLYLSRVQGRIEESSLKGGRQIRYFWGEGGAKMLAPQNFTLPPPPPLPDYKYLSLSLCSSVSIHLYLYLSLSYMLLYNKIFLYLSLSYRIYLEIPLSLYDLCLSVFLYLFHSLSLSFIHMIYYNNIFFLQTNVHGELYL